MQRYIDADALKETIANNVYPVADFFNSRDYGMFWTGGIEKAIDEQPAADVAPVRHGRWEAAIITDIFGLKHDCYVCSVCGAANNDDDDEYDFCPNCGAKMDGGAIGDPMEDDLK